MVMETFIQSTKPNLTSTDSFTISISVASRHLFFHRTLAEVRNNNTCNNLFFHSSLEDSEARRFPSQSLFLRGKKI
jgi:hypothetical protein